MSDLKPDLWDEARKVYVKQSGTRESWSYEDIDTKIECAQKVYEELTEREAKLVEGLRFYKNGFVPYQQFKHLPGLAWKPSEELLDDCGNVAKATLKSLGIKGEG